MACIGGSNGGLLVGNMLTRPTGAALFGAIVCQAIIEENYTMPQRCSAGVADY